ncbi:class I SAM-dependent methyltransferase [Streptomyces sp. NBC_00249]|uniref:class I SAM-dependent methyltransferase n=1 Tax=Streptomyces sp. NBC_00249 TaxID=2975690 RepID=UPI00224F907A|nr:class I SAM-dependent methyltransferase [Streptomyces sp. NBC_00249]MCX5195164.1 class I SAM-dependent methyltransferase [Streptomyces sp. NBC_00249]
MPHVSQAPVTAPDVEPAPPEPSTFGEVKGWFSAYDQVLFDWFLTRQNEDHEASGDILELGVFMGKSAIFLAGYLRDGEEFTVCDLFDSPAPDDFNLAEMRDSYPTLTRRGFETNYLAFHEALPTVIQAPTSVVADRVRPGSCRFVHVDASHLHEHVVQDIASSRPVATPDAVVVFDDYRAAHCPGVAAAVWAAVATGELHVIAVSASKLYATWGDPAPHQAALLGWLEGRTDLWHGVDIVHGRPLVRIGDEGVTAPPPPKPLRAPAESEPQAPAVPAPAPKAAAVRPGAHWRRLAKDLLPPLLTRAIVARRRRRA